MFKEAEDFSRATCEEGQRKDGKPESRAVLSTDSGGNIDTAGAIGKASGFTLPQSSISLYID